jgi:hypothetical protein
MIHLPLSARAMNESEIEVVARAASEHDTGRSDWGRGSERMATWDRWRGIARSALAALDQGRQQKADWQFAQQAHLTAQLADLGRQEARC